MSDTTLTWLGHAAFRLETADGTRIYVDPFLHGNPKCPEAERQPERVDVIAVTHGHGDHVGDTVDLAKSHGAQVVALVELANWFGSQGVDEGKLLGPNKGGTVEAGGASFTLVNAFHSGSAPDGSYAGEPAGIVGDMQLIGRIYEPDVAVLPIGDHYTMGPAEAAVAAELVGAKRVVPCHFGTFPLLRGTPDELARLVPDGVAVEQVEPGGSLTL